MKKRLLVLAMLIGSIFAISFGENSTAKGYYCPYMQRCGGGSGPVVPGSPDGGGCSDCSCQTISGDRPGSVRRVCGT